MAAGKIIDREWRAVAVYVDDTGERGPWESTPKAAGEAFAYFRDHVAKATKDLFIEVRKITFSAPARDEEATRAAVREEGDEHA